MQVNYSVPLSLTEIMIQAEKGTVLNISFLLVILLLHKVNSAIYFVMPDNHSSHYRDANTFSFQHFLNNTSNYIVSHNQFHFMQGQYYLNINKNLKI